MCSLHQNLYSKVLCICFTIKNKITVCVLLKIPLFFYCKKLNKVAHAVVKVRVINYLLHQILFKISIIYDIYIFLVRAMRVFSFLYKEGY